MHVTLQLVLWIYIVVFKIWIVDLNWSIWPSYENILADQILHYFYNFLAIFKNGRKSIHLKVLDRLKIVIFDIFKTKI